MSGVRHSEKSHNSSGEITIGEIHRRHTAFLDEQPMTVSCGFGGCDWTFEGSVADGRQASLDHRVAVHPEVSDAAKLLARRQKETRLQTKAVREKRYADEAKATGREPVVSRPREVAAARSDEAVVVATALDLGLVAAERYGLKKVGRGYIWTRETALRAVAEFALEHGRAPSSSDAKRLATGVLPSSMSAKDLFGSWAALIEEAGFARPTRATRYLAPVLEEVAAVGETAVSGAAAGIGEPERVATSSSADVVQLPTPSSDVEKPEARIAHAVLAAGRAFIETLERELLDALEAEEAA